MQTLSDRKSTLLLNIASEQAFLKLRELLLDKDKNIRETILRIIRFIAITHHAFEIMLHQNIHLLITRCLEREVKPNFLMERFQALKLISHWIETDPQSVPFLFFQSLVSVATFQSEDQLKKPVIETLRKGSIFCTHLCTWAGGLNVLINSITDPSCSETSESVVHTILFLIDEPKTRAFIREYTDLGSIFSPFTETISKPKEMRGEAQKRIEQQLQLGKKAITLMMKNWSGLLFLTCYPNYLPSLVQTLMQPVTLEVKKTIFAIFFELFNVNMPFGEDLALAENFLSPYMNIVVQSLNICGIYDILIEVTSTEDLELIELSRRLLKILMQLSSVLIPECPKFLSLITMASDFKLVDPSLRLQASRTLRKLAESHSFVAKLPLEIKQDISEPFLRVSLFDKTAKYMGPTEKSNR